MKLAVNGVERVLPEGLADPSMPLLWALRDLLGLTGTKYGCGIGACGACTVHVGGQAVRSCMTPIGSIGARPVMTIEALGGPGRWHPVQAAWIEAQVPQCGYCQSGLLMACAALLARNANPTDAEIDATIDNLCRCGTTPRVRAALRAAAERLRGAAAPGAPVAPQRGGTAAAGAGAGAGATKAP